MVEYENEGVFVVRGGMHQLVEADVRIPGRLEGDALVVPEVGEPVELVAVHRADY